MTLGPVVAGTRLAKDEVVWSEKLTEGSRADCVHRSWFQVHQDGAGHVAAAHALVEINVHAFELKVIVANVVSIRGHTVLLAHDLPKLGTDLVAALAGLKVDNFSHGK